MIIAVSIARPVQAGEFKTAKATAYCLKGKTASGKYTAPNMVASKREYIGSTMLIWIDTGDHLPHPENFLGTYEVTDTGSEPIRKGYVLDIWLPTYEEAKQFGYKQVIYQVIESEG